MGLMKMLKGYTKCEVCFQRTLGAKVRFSGTSTQIGLICMPCLKRALVEPLATEDMKKWVAKIREEHKQ